MKPFEIAIPQSDVDDLHRRLDQTRWPDPVAGAGWAQGTPQEHLQELVRRWRNFDWREQERRLNEIPQFVTEVDGVPLHFLHVRSARKDAEPLLLTHGWPTTCFAFEAMIEPLSRDFHLVVPSVPGFGFSGPTRELGWTIPRVADVVAELMRRLGYDRYVAHGYDYGAMLTRRLGMRDEVRAIHVNQIFSAGVTAETADMEVEAERRSVEKAYRYEFEQFGYVSMQSTRPQSVAYALTDSPVAQLEWIEWAFRTWSDPEIGVPLDALLTNASIFWFTRTAGSSARYYQEGDETWGEPEPHSVTPTSVAVFPHDVGVPIRRMAERNHTIARWTEMPRGGHFAALEVPELMVRELREAFLL
ncbi:epoxide hydrolase family protein [Lentzea sp. DG1S-22]|uniref:epoxide hydrolase family protein n=1 Tax=Lentzea sp. DG1S-22 TaxID=3108822 RepID=UPI002E76EE6A|nr:epoxide hydrolase family protein [Lentzea sp. DG1S-22]WVH83789.1 epoxide hydrolase family protein [Lentzea sp. DG1S-22]